MWSIKIHKKHDWWSVLIQYTSLLVCRGEGGGTPSVFNLYEDAPIRRGADPFPFITLSPSTRSIMRQPPVISWSLATCQQNHSTLERKTNKIKLSSGQSVCLSMSTDIHGLTAQYWVISWGKLIILVQEKIKIFTPGFPLVFEISRKKTNKLKQCNKITRWSHSRSRQQKLSRFGHECCQPLIIWSQIKSQMLTFCNMPSKLLLPLVLLNIFLSFSLVLCQIPIPKKPLGYVFNNGKESAPIHLEIYADLTCPDCQQCWPIVKQLADFYGPEKLRLVVQTFALPYHTNSFIAAQVVYSNWIIFVTYKR